MAKIKIDKNEIAKMLIDQLGCKSVDWDSDGAANVELDLEEIKKKEKEIVKEEHHHHYPYQYPIYIYKKEPYRPYWTINTKTITGSNIMSLSYTGKSMK